MTIMTTLVSLGEARLVDRKFRSNQIARRKREGRFILCIFYVIARALLLFARSNLHVMRRLFRREEYPPRNDITFSEAH
jgi:hypothetical protein